MTKYFYNFHNKEEKPFVKGIKEDEWIKLEYEERYNTMISKVVEAKKRYDANHRDPFKNHK